MSAPSPFQIAQTVGNKLGQIPINIADRSAIDEIMERASKTQNPADMEQILGDVIKNVSPDRRQAVLGAVTQKAKDLQMKQQQVNKAKQYEEMGLPPGLASLPDSVQAAYIRENMKNQGGMDRFNQIRGMSNQPRGGLGQESEDPGELDESLNVEELEGDPTSAPPVNIDQALQDPSAKGIQALTDDTLIAMTTMPGYAEPAKQELKRRQEAEKETRADIRASKKETLKAKEEITKKANDARKGLRNKEFLLRKIDEGNLDDPSFAVLAENLPFNLGKRLLSPESVTYKAALVDEFGDLRNIFQGQTRVKELEILEEKLPSLYLTDEQKKAILKSRADALQVDILREEAAAEVDEKYPNLGLLQFNKKVNELSKKKEKSLFEKILGDQKAILEQAERRKKIPLDPNNPEDAKIAVQILKEAGGNRNKARQLAIKKGYKIK